MTERLYRANDVAARYSVSVQTARAYMRQMRHTEKPLTVRESDMLSWDFERMIDPAEKKKQKRVTRTTSSFQRSADGKYHIPRRPF